MKSKKSIYYLRRTHGGWRLSNRSSKYHSQKCIIDGIVFASQAEGALYSLLKAEHTAVYCQPKIYLSKAKILYKPDFFAGDVYYEAKGFETPSWRIKRRLWKAYGPGELRVFKMVKGKPCFFESIMPESASYDSQDKRE